MENYIDVTGIDLRGLIKAAYELSEPQGMGFLHFTPEPLTDEEADAILENGGRFCAFNMDYVKGRAVKFGVRKHEGRLWVQDRWFDHSQAALHKLLGKFGITFEDRREQQ